MPEGSSVVGRIFERLAEGEFELQALVVTDVLPSHLHPHRADIFGGEAEGLQIRKTEPGFAESGAQLDTLAIGAERFSGPAGKPQRVAVRQPYELVLRVLRKKMGEDLYGALVVP